MGLPAGADGRVPPYVSIMGAESSGYVYVRVADEVEAEIRSGRLPVGARLPNERDMGAQYGVAPGTARRAVQELRDRGLVVTLPNKGTFVTNKPKGEGSSGGER
jgi:GntR family transcriptional regulator